MADQSNGPPECERPAPPQDWPSAEQLTDAPDHNAQNYDQPGKSLVWIPCTRPPAPQDLKSQLQQDHSTS